MKYIPKRLAAPNTMGMPYKHFVYYKLTNCGFLVDIYLRNPTRAILKENIAEFPFLPPSRHPFTVEQGVEI